MIDFASFKAQMLLFKKNKKEQDENKDAKDQKLDGKNIGEQTPRETFFKLKDEDCKPEHGWRKSLDVKRPTHYGGIYQKSTGVAG